MPFIPFNTANYRPSTPNASVEQDDSSNLRPGSNPRSRSHSQSQVQTQTQANPNSKSSSRPGSNSNSTTNLNASNTNFPGSEYGGSNNSNNNSGNNSPSLQQHGSLQLRRKKSVGNAILSLVNSIRPSTSSQYTSSPHQSLRRGSQSSQPRSRSASVSLSKQGSNSNIMGNNNNNNNTDNTNNNNNNSNNNNSNNNISENSPPANPFDVSEEVIRAFIRTGSGTLDNVNNVQHNRNQQQQQQRKQPLESVQLGTIISGDNTTNDSNTNSNTNNSRFSNLGFQTNFNLDLQSTSSSRLDPFNNLTSNSQVDLSNNESRVSPSPHIFTSFDNIGNNGNVNSSVVITNEDNSAHNTFSPNSYNYNLSNSQTIGNFREFTDDINVIINGNDNSNANANVEDSDMIRFASPLNNTNTTSANSNNNQDIRSRGNTLRNDTIGSVGMSTENNQTIGNTFNNPITIGDITEDIVLNNRVGNEAGEEADGDAIMVDNGIVNTNSIGDSDTKGKGCDSNGNYSIRLTPSIDHSSTYPYMFFGPIIRKIKPGMTLAIGRYTEKNKKAALAAPGSSASIVFKSKVVSREHGELTVDNEGKWYIKDVSSSSGTFLNHVRLSVPNKDSQNVLLKDSDILQLGVDYRGGSEEIYRCVKVKIELNNSWKKRTARFNREAHEKLKTLTGKDGNRGSNGATDADSGDSGDGHSSQMGLSPCVICLDDIKACQAVFVSSCSHSWHYRCIRPLLVKTYPQFLCPNCKAVCDLEAADEEESEGEDSG